jgi:glucose dehydrogenase
MLWRWHTVPSPDEPGGDTWPPGAFATGGVGVWMNSTIDEKYRQVLFATGNPNPDFDGSGRKGDNLYSCSVVSVDADTGKLKWYFQEVRHDLWDYDQSSAPILFTSKAGGQSVDAAGAAGKTGWFYMLDRRTGKSLVPLKEVKTGGTGDESPVQWVPDQEPFVPHTNMWAPPRVLFNSNVAPGLSGGAEWSPLSYSPRTNYIYVAAIEMEMYFCRDPFAATAVVAGASKEATTGAAPSTQNPLTCIALAIFANLAGLNLGGIAVVPPATKVHGEFIAIDADTGKTVDGWSYPTTPHPIGGTLATAGDLVFAGESNGWFNALDAKSGKRLWRFQCGAGVNAAPMTFALPDGAGKMRQYVAVAAGGLAGASLPNATPGDPNAFKYFRSGNTVIVFALPDE